jgi:hypothetical protein
MGSRKVHRFLRPFLSLVFRSTPAQSPLHPRAKRARARVNGNSKGKRNINTNVDELPTIKRSKDAQFPSPPSV